jgi:hypothetical protein
MPLVRQQQHNKIKLELETMNFRKLMNVLVCTLVLSIGLVSVGAASVSSEMIKYDSANEAQFKALEKSFMNQYEQLTKQNDNIVIISNSANFENYNVVRTYEDLGNGQIKLTDYRGRTETTDLKMLRSTYECHFFNNDAPEEFDTSGTVSSNNLKVSKKVKPVTVGSEMQKYNNASEKQFDKLEKSFKSQYKQLNNQPQIVVISMSANFENSNVVRVYEIYEDGNIILTNYRGYQEATDLNTLESNYECHFFNNDAPEEFDTSGTVSSNFDEL